MDGGDAELEQALAGLAFPGMEYTSQSVGAATEEAGAPRDHRDRDRDRDHRDHLPGRDREHRDPDHQQAGDTSTAQPPDATAESAPTQRRDASGDVSDSESSASSIEYYGGDVADEVNDPAAYGPGGYLKVKLGDEFNDRYVIEERLGWGHFSTVWLATDKKAPQGSRHKTVALKIQKSAKHYCDAARDEIELLSEARRKGGPGRQYVVQQLGHFTVFARNGQHYVFVFEVLGENLLDLIRRYKYRGLPRALVKKITKDVLIGLDYLHTKCQIIHTDLKPENVLMTRTTPLDMVKIRKNRDAIMRSQKQRELEKYQAKLQQDSSSSKPKLSPSKREKYERKIVKLKEYLDKTPKTAHKARTRSFDSADQQPPESLKELLDPTSPKRPRAVVVDLGNACWTFKHFTDDITTRQYRSPEAIIGKKYDTGVDLWSLACMTFELLTGDYLFDPKDDQDQTFSRDEDHLALIWELTGRPEKTYAEKGHYAHHFFNKKGKLRHIKKLEFWPLTDVLTEKYQMPVDEAELFASFLITMIVLEPETRKTAGQIAEHPWLVITEEDKQGALEQERAWLENTAPITPSTPPENPAELLKQGYAKAGGIKIGSSIPVNLSAGRQRAGSV